jgi:hypothetical protein
MLGEILPMMGLVFVLWFFLRGVICGAFGVLRRNLNYWKNKLGIERINAFVAGNVSRVVPGRRLVLNTMLSLDIGIVVIIAGNVLMVVLLEL